MSVDLFNEKTNLLPKDGEVLFFPEFFASDESDHYFQILLKETEWRQEPIFLFGKKVLQPRLTAWYGESGKDIKYSGITMKPHSWTKSLLEIKKRIEIEAGVTFTSALLNQYRDERDSVGWHRDNEKELGVNPVIGSVSFGATRIFRFRHYFDKSIKKSVKLSHGSYLLMRGKTQHFWEHSIPKRARPASARINITFRVVVF
ncbi:MAG: alpha-ketoglutarate-dependent dioxygenase AlkB [Bdellovibrionia bacterium]